MRTITINNKQYELKSINFRQLVELEKLGFSIKTLQNIEENYWGALNSLVAFVCDCDLQQAEKEIESHIENGGTLNDFAPLFDMVTNSDFFRKMSK